MAPETTARSNISHFPDVIYYVVSHLDPWIPEGDLDVYTVRRALARLAGTCRNFTRPALKMLWKHLPDDQPLADLLCILGIAQRHGALNSEVGSGATKLARFEVPIQLHPGLWFSTSERDAVERRWKSLRGYDVRYVSIQSFNSIVCWLICLLCRPYVTRATLLPTHIGNASKSTHPMCERSRCLR